MRSGKENQGLSAPSPAKNYKKDLFTSPLKAVPPAEPELLTDENPDRYTMFPIKCQTVWEYYKKAEASFWTGKLILIFSVGKIERQLVKIRLTLIALIAAEEVDLGDDQKHWEKLSDDEKHFIKVSELSRTRLIKSD